MNMKTEPTHAPVTERHRELASKLFAMSPEQTRCQLLAASEAEAVAKATADCKINTNVRLFDLVRFMRAELHEADLITDEEYVWLCAEAPMAHSKQGGSPSPRRLEDYDDLHAQLRDMTDQFFGVSQQLAAAQVDSRRLRNALGPVAEKLERVCAVIYPNGIPEAVMVMLHTARVAMKGTP